jgi:hypothetical protein
MKRFATVVGSILVAWAVTGCDSGGIQEGTAKEEGTPQNADFQKLMEANSKNMQVKGGPPAGFQRAVPTEGAAGAPGPAGAPGGPAGPAGAPGRR